MAKGKTEKKKEIEVVGEKTIEVVSERVRKLMKDGELNLPDGYSPENALKSAWLVLQGTKDKNDKSVLEVCTKSSIANSLLDMVVQGLNPVKDQGYFIAYGDKLLFQRSYFGSMAIAKRVAGVKEILAEVVYDGDEFEYEIEDGYKKITKHKQGLENIDKGKIIAAYCIIHVDDEKHSRSQYTEIMTMDQITKAWKMSKAYGSDGTKAHKQFPDQMAKKTIINRTCKSLINASMDNDLFIHHYSRTDYETSVDQLEKETEESANQEFIDVETEPEENGEVVDVEVDEEEKVEETKKTSKKEEDVPW